MVNIYATEFVATLVLRIIKKNMNRYIFQKKVVSAVHLVLSVMANLY